MPPTGCSIPRCEKSQLARGLCASHYRKARKRGQLDRYPRERCTPGMSLGQRLITRGWDTIDGHWIFHGCGSLNVKDQPSMTVIRAAWVAWRGKLNDGDRVMSKCGVPLCIRPDHLFVKDKRWYFEDLVAQAVAARHIRQEHKERHYRLSPAQVREVDTLVRRARVGLMEGLLTRAEFETEAQRVNAFVEAITRGCCAPTINQIGGRRAV